MPQGKKLLAATDFSTPARHALERDALLVQGHPGARLTLAHVISRSALDTLRRLFSQDAAALEATLLEQARRNLGELAQRLATGHGCAIDTALKQGSALAALVELAEEEQADLLAMEELLLSSVTQHVLKQSSSDVLVAGQPV